MKFPWQNRNQHKFGVDFGATRPGNSFYSAFYSRDHTHRAVSDDFFSILIQSVTKAREMQRKKYMAESLVDNHFNVYPGEHYSLLSALVENFSVGQSFEIGSFKGLGTLALLGADATSRKVITNDLIPFEDFDSVIPKKMYRNDTVTQLVGNLLDDDFFRTSAPLLQTSELIFLDGPKDGVFEYEMLKRLASLDLPKTRLLIIDDINFANMISLWRSIASPKIDITSFGHWSGTGIVEINSKLELHKLH
jgi:predicted O-methyltransferase YrrM